MGDVALLRRIDTKYVVSEAQLSWALARVTDDYRILEIDGRRLHRYETLYFDTPELALFRQHHNGWRNRYKVRERAYTDSDLVFLEIKHKIDDNTTIKKRVLTPELTSEIARVAEPFMRAHYPYRVAALQPTLLNAFQRIALVSKHRLERLTLDVDVRFWGNGSRCTLDGVAIAELKQDGFSLNSEFVQQMRELGVRSTGFSKYCTGVSMLYPQVKHNRFKPRLRLLEELMGGDDNARRAH
jgi:hypothetical protein